MSERHVMIDLETLSTRTDAAIISIGAYHFDPYAGRQPWAPDQMFTMGVTLDSAVAAGGRVDEGAFAWWLEQTETARAALRAEGAQDIRLALWGLTDFIRRAPPNDVSDIVVWSHAGFDFAILDHAYDALDIPKPYWYRSPRDLRTIIHAAFGRNLDVEDEVEGFPRNPSSHEAGFDAWHQSVMVQECFQRLGWGMNSEVTPDGD